ncbi:MAG TPA: S8 family serine peptidase, partial [Chitinophagaceae bacterium]|nr:S8 family serine peptidase [Chitinophagaceae bacterium]
MMRRIKQSLLLLTVAGSFLNASAQTSSREDVPHEWHLRDRQKDGYYGVSIDKAYEFVKNKKSKTVIVAVIDSGIDTLHEDLKPVLWTNTKEIAGNGTDDDKNGYVDDVHGWNFIGGKDGRNVTKDSYEAARVYHKYKQRFQTISDSTTLATEADKQLYAEWKRSEQQITGGDSNNGLELLMLKRTYNAAVASDSILRKGFAKAKYSGKELESYAAVTEDQKKAKRMLLVFFTQQEGAMEMTNEALLADFKGYLESEEQKAEASDKAPVNYRGDIIKDNYDDFNDRFYGNNNIMVDLNGATHGTHVAG